MHRVNKLEFVFLVLGIGAAGVAVTPFVRARLARSVSVYARSTAETANLQSSSNDAAIIPEASLATTYPSASYDEQTASHAIGTLHMPALGLDVPLVSGIDSAALSRGVGHVLGSAFAGGLGNMVLAGHRDTFLRPLRSVKPGMDVFIDSPRGRYLYRVDRSEVVTPDDLKVLDIGQRPELTLITCYPFNFLGSAPKRFIVHAHLVSLAPEPLPR
jgi:sortase A